MRQYAIDLKAAGESAVAALKEHQLLLLTDKSLPSLVALVVGAPVRGSWWAHPLCHEIYMVSQHLHDHSDVLRLKLVNGKTTYVHRSLWPTLHAVATGRDEWQMKGLAASTRALLSRIDECGRARVDELSAHRGKKELGEDARILESRLLVYGDDVHTDSGLHVKRIETWNHWAARASFVPDVPVSSREERARLDAMVDDWRIRFETRVSLPWHPSPGRAPRPA